MRWENQVILEACTFNQLWCGLLSIGLPSEQLPNLQLLVIWRHGLLWELKLRDGFFRFVFVVEDSGYFGGEHEPDGYGLLFSL